MKHALAAVLGMFLFFVFVLGTLFFTAPSAEPAPVEPTGCVINLVGVKVCGTLLGQPLPEVVTVTVPPVTIPGPTRTVTVAPEPIRVTETIRPQPVRVTETVTVAPQPQPQSTITKTVQPRPTVTETVRPNGEPAPTVTVTPEPEIVTETRQSDPESGTVEPSDDDDFFRYDLDLDDESISAGEAGIGLLSALLIFALVLGGMSYGFYMGRRTGESEEANFLRVLLDRTKTK